MKYIISIILWNVLAVISQAQTMKWIPMEAGMAKGPCTIESHAKQQEICYALQYTPAVSGTLTSYTTGFYVSCTSMGSPVLKNRSCTMAGNVRLINDCDGSKLVLMNSSGNTGTIANSKVEANVPVILHQVCFSIPVGESVTIKEDPITDLTTSIDVIDGHPVTEFPEFTELTIRHDRYDVSKPGWFGFTGVPAGNFISRLDWSGLVSSGTSHFNVERSDDGKNFIPIGKVEVGQNSDNPAGFQFFDRSAIHGKNYYRLQKVDFDDRTEYSKVCTVSFSEDALSVKCSPNPADDFLQIDIQSPATINAIKLIDATGRVVEEEKNDSKSFTTRLNVKKLNPGVYILAVETDEDKFSEKVMISH